MKSCELLVLAVLFIGRWNAEADTIMGATCVYHCTPCGRKKEPVVSFLFNT